MSEFHVRVVTVGPIRKHPNADTLSITDVDGGYPCIIRTGDFQEGDKAVYLPIDSMVKVAEPRFAFLASKDKPRERERIKAKRLRGIFSMGMLVKGDAAWNIGQNVQAELDITKYEPPEPMGMGGECEKDPGFIPTYTDIEGLRNHLTLLRDGEEVVLTEKIHGTNSRFLWQEGRLWVGGHKTVKKENPDNLYWKEALKNGLKEKLAQAPNIAFYGEIFGWVQSLRYDLQRGNSKLAFFDAMDTTTRRYLDYDEFTALLQKLGLTQVPVLYRGPWSKELWKHADGESTIAKHIREGFVVRPVKERFEETLGGRCILKLHGEEFLLKG